MNMELSRHSFICGAGASLVGKSLGALGFGEIETARTLSIRPFKPAQTKEARSQCSYCAACCGMLILSAGSKEEKVKIEVAHIESDVDHPVNRGTLCPKGAGALDYIKSKTRVEYPMYCKNAERLTEGQP